MIDKSIFRTNDIRGNSKNKLTADVAYNVGISFAKINIVPANNKIVVGYDGRLSTPALFEALIQGLNEGGAEVSSIGLVPTPVLYFADRKIHPAASIMITGSHNEKDDNGFKMLSGSKSFYGEKIQELLGHILKNQRKYRHNKENSKFFNVNVKPFYYERILKDITIDPKLNIVWDTGNGSAGNIIKELITKLPNKNHIINEEVDGNFPNREPDTSSPENLKQLKDSVKKEKADFGIAFDGDADRISIVTNSGETLFGDQLLCIYTKELLERKPGSIIIADSKASKALFDYVDSLGGKAIMWKTGHALIRAKMIETNAEIAGEMSGHIFFADRYLGFDDAIYASLRLIDVISKGDETLDQIVDKLPKTINTPEIRLYVKDDEKFKIVEELKKKLDSKNIKYSDLDGIRAELDKGWWLVRASNTQAALIVRCEAEDKKSLKEMITNLNNLLEEYSLQVEA